MGARVQTRVLVVDDEVHVREALRLVLGRDGHQVELAGSGGEALELYKPGRFDLVITDYAMMDMNGEEVAARIKAQDPKQPVLMVSAYIEVLTRTQGNTLTTADILLNKPFTVQQLRDAIGLALGPGPE